MATKKIFRKDLLIENLRKKLYVGYNSCRWCPIIKECEHNGYALCSDERADEFAQEIIDKFSEDVEFVEVEDDE